MCRRHLPRFVARRSACAREQRRECATVPGPVAELPPQPELAVGAGPAEHARDITTCPPTPIQRTDATVRKHRSRRNPRRRKTAQPAPSEPQRRPQPLGSERRVGAGRYRLHERAEIRFRGHRDQGLRRRDRRDAEKSRQRLLLPRQREVRQERFRRRDRRLRPGAAARPVGPGLSQQPRRRLRSQEGYRPRARRLQRRRSRPTPIRSMPTTTAAPPFSARATSPAPPPTTAR